MEASHLLASIKGGATDVKNLNGSAVAEHKTPAGLLMKIKKNEKQIAALLTAMRREV